MVTAAADRVTAAAAQGRGRAVAEFRRAFAAPGAFEPSKDFAGLGKRLQWSAPFPEWLAWVAFGAMAMGSALTYWGMRSNRFFSSYVRIQTDRGHQVVEDGPYAYVRHPGYAGVILFTLGTPIQLDSLPAFGLAVVTTLITVVRTFLEDRTLQQELPGYRKYAQTVRYRLMPLLW